MSLIQPDAVVIGNHEFDDGILSYTNTYAKWGTYTNLAANYVFPDPKNPNNHQLGRYTQPYTILDVDVLLVGVIGMVSVSSITEMEQG